MNWRVRFIDYPKQYAAHRDEILPTIDRLLADGDLMLRDQLREFEENLATFVGTRFAVGTSNCTDALRLCMRALELNPGDEVITVGHTFVASIAAIRDAGAVPTLVDIGEDHNMDPDALKAAVTPQTRGIVPVHLNGRLCDMARIMEIAETFDLWVVEDSAQALGASLDGIKGGAFGIAGCFSFYPAKLLGAPGDAGALVSNDEELVEKLQLLRNHGRTADGVGEWGYNCRLDNIWAAVLDVKLRRVPGYIERRREIAAIYEEQLSACSGITLPPQPASDGARFDVFQNYEIEADGRDVLEKALTEARIETMRPWGGKAVHEFPALGLNFDLPVTERIMRRALHLPLHCELENEDVEYVCTTIRSALGS